MVRAVDLSVTQVAPRDDLVQLHGPRQLSKGMGTEDSQKIISYRMTNNANCYGFGSQTWR